MVVYNEEETIRISLRSALTVADEVIIALDDRTNDKTEQLINELNDGRVRIIKHQFYDHFGNQRQLANDNATGDWVLFLDADECLGDNAPEIIREIIEKEDVDCYHFEYIHFIHDFAHIDNSEPVHIGLSRLYKKYDGIKYTRQTHALPEYEFKNINFLAGIGIFHLGYLRGIFKIRERYLRNVAISTIHPRFYIENWKYWHYLNYPTKPFGVQFIPKIIKEEFKIEL